MSTIGDYVPSANPISYLKSALSFMRFKKCFLLFFILPFSEPAKVEKSPNDLLIDKHEGEITKFEEQTNALTKYIS